MTETSDKGESVRQDLDRRLKALHENSNVQIAYWTNPPRDIIERILLDCPRIIMKGLKLSQPLLLYEVDVEWGMGKRKMGFSAWDCRSCGYLRLIGCYRLAKTWPDISLSVHWPLTNSSQIILSPLNILQLRVCFCSWDSMIHMHIRSINQSIV